jgi:hypothetical protein
VWRTGRNPNGSQRGHNPYALLRVDGHDSFRSKDQLIFRMEVLGNYVRVVKVMGDAGDLGQCLAFSIENDALALLRHFLSQ